MNDENSVSDEIRECQLNADRQRLECLVKLTSEAIVSTDGDQTICNVNPAAARLFGYAPEELIGEPLGRLIPAHLRHLHACHVQRFLESASEEQAMGRRQEVTGLRKDGSTFPAQASIFKSSFSDGSTGMTAILRDISKDKYIKEVEENVRLSRQIQLHFFPRQLPQLTGIDVSAVNVPSQGISGDYYDFIPIVDGHWGLAIADVAGKGLSAGLMMSTFRAALLAEIRNNYSISVIMTKVNNLLWETSAANRFVTAFYAVFDEQRQILTYSNAGHNPPLLIRHDGSIEELQTGGMLLGAFKDCQYQEERISLSSKDWLLLYTDGLTDSIGPDGQELGREGLIQFVRSLPDTSASSLCQELIRWAGATIDPPEDDISLLIIRLTS